MRMLVHIGRSLSSGAAAVVMTLRGPHAFFPSPSLRDRFVNCCMFSIWAIAIPALLLSIWGMGVGSALLLAATGCLFQLGLRGMVRGVATNVRTSGSVTATMYYRRNGTVVSSYHDIPPRGHTAYWPFNVLIGQLSTLFGFVVLSLIMGFCLDPSRPPVGASPVLLTTYGLKLLSSEVLGILLNVVIIMLIVRGTVYMAKNFMVTIRTTTRTRNLQ